MDREQIVEQVERICQSQEFSQKQLMANFLRYLVQKFLEGKGDELKGYTIAVELFGQEEHFDPDQNALVRINAGRLRRSLKLYYLEEGLNDQIVIEIPKGQYCPKIISRKESSSISAPSINDVRLSSESKIAVLPLENHSIDSDLNYLAVGIAQELSDALTKYDDLKVIGLNRASNREIDGYQEMEELHDMGVNYLINGELMAYGSQVKLRFRLIHLADNLRLWTGEYKFDHKKENLFDIQEKVSSIIGSHLGGEYSQISKHRYEKLLASKPTSLNEQELLLKHNYAQTILSADIFTKLLELAHDTLSKEPESALANALVGSIYSSIYTQDIAASADAYVKCGEYAEKAYTLNPNHKFVIATLAGKCFHYGDKERIFRLYQQCKDWLPTTPMGLGVFGMWFSLFGDWELGKGIIDRVYESNIDVPSWYDGIRSLYHYKNKNYEKALDDARKYRLPGFYLGPVHRLAPLAQLGRIEEAQMEYVALLKVRPDFETRGRYLLQLHIKEDTLVDHILEGFVKIGVNVD